MADGQVSENALYTVTQQSVTQSREKKTLKTLVLSAYHILAIYCKAAVSVVIEKKKKHSKP